MSPLSDVLAATTQEKKQVAVTSAPMPTVVQIPSNYSIQIASRKQVFNLSCEFAAAAAILYHFTTDSQFSVQNEEQAEKTLIGKVGVSKNPNIGVRMGDSIKSSEDPLLYENLNKLFGGTDYYGVHAPPFIDLFAQYSLVARPLNKNDNIINILQKTLFSGHLVMTWIHVGYGQAVDVSLDYGTTSVFKGEHSIVIHGYDETGVFVMDPGSGVDRHISYENLIEAVKLFPMPFLAVYTASSPQDLSSQDLISVGTDKVTGLDRGKLTVLVENGSGMIGKGSEMANILRDFGYHVTTVKNADNTDYEKITIRLKKSLRDYVPVIKRDLKNAFFPTASITSNLPEDGVDMEVVVGS